VDSPAQKQEILLPLLMQAGQALQSLHDDDIAHNDIKSQNFLICGDRVVLADLGGIYEERSICHLTKKYAPPEANCDNVQTDVWAFGVMSFDGLRRMMDDEEEFEEVASTVAADEVETPGRLRAFVNSWFSIFGKNNAESLSSSGSSSNADSMSVESSSDSVVGEEYDQSEVQAYAEEGSDIDESETTAFEGNDEGSSDYDESESENLDEYDEEGSDYDESVSGDVDEYDEEGSDYDESETEDVDEYDEEGSDYDESENAEEYDEEEEGSESEMEESISEAAQSEAEIPQEVVSNNGVQESRVCEGVFIESCSDSVCCCTKTVALWEEEDSEFFEDADLLSAMYSLIQCNPDRNLATIMNTLNNISGIVGHQ